MSQFKGRIKRQLEHGKLIPNHVLRRKKNGTSGSRR